jgi:hypothetical protein
MSLNQSVTDVLDSYTARFFGYFLVVQQESTSPAGARPGADVEAKVESRRWRHGGETNLLLDSRFRGNDEALPHPRKHPLHCNQGIIAGFVGALAYRLRC